jgi:hypothetical protein
MKKPAKRKRSPAPDFNQVAQRMVRLSTGQEQPEPKVTQSEINRVMAELGRRGGKIGGKQRMVTMTAEQRSEIAAKGARAMWAKKKARKGR